MELELETNVFGSTAMMVGPGEGICLLQDERLLVFKKNAQTPVKFIDLEEDD